jgi:hypothetical protein
LPVEDINLSLLEHNLDIPYLESLGTDDWNLTPRQLIKNFSYETHHAQKVTKADISYPIEIYFFNNQWVILDGVHRFTKLVMSGITMLRVRKVTETILPLIKKTDAEFKQWKGEA